MLFLLKTLHNLIKVLHSETAPSQLASGLAFGMIVGLTPFVSLHNLVIFFIVALFRVNFSMFFLSLGIFSVTAFALDSLFDQVGYSLLVSLTAARPFWISITSGALWPFFRFNNTVVMGSLAVSLALFFPVMLGGIVFIRVYRERWKEKMQNSKFMKALKATPFYGLYEKYQNFRERMSAFS